MREEFDLATDMGVLAVPVRATGSMAAKFASELRRNSGVSDAPASYAKVLEILWNDTEPGAIIVAIVAFMNDIND